MQILWDHGPLDPVGIQNLFPRTIKNPALRAVLTVLQEKGHVTRNKQGRAYFYKAKTPQQGTFQKMVRNLSKIFCEGSPKTLIAQLIEMEKLSEEDIEELKHIAVKNPGVRNKGGKKNVDRN